jgi:hypothetical protein
VRVYFKLVGNVHVFGALEHLRVDKVCDGRLILAGKVFVEQFGKTPLFSTSVLSSVFLAS